MQPQTMEEEQEMYKLRTLAVVSGLMAALFAGSGVASAGMSWCDVGCPPPMHAERVDNPQNNPHGMPTPDYNSKFELPSGISR